MSDIQIASNADLKKRVTETVRASFGMLIPETEWQAMVDKEVLEYFNADAEFVVVELHEEVTEKASTWSTHQRTFDKKVGVGLAKQMTPFKVQVYAEVSKLVRKKLETFLSSGEFKTEVMTLYDDNSPVCTELSAEMDKRLEKMALSMAAMALRDTFANSVVAARNQLVTEFNLVDVKQDLEQRRGY
jgi:hypothetical protein